MAQASEHFVKQQVAGALTYLTVTNPATTLAVYDQGGGVFKLRLNGTEFAQYSTLQEAESALSALVQDLGEVHVLPAD